MPLYEVTLIPRQLGKTELFNALKRGVNLLLDHGAVITDMKSLGHRELPFKRLSKQGKEPVHESTYLLLKAYMPVQKQNDALKLLSNDLDMAFAHFVNTKDLDRPIAECNLDDLLKPPVYRESVKALRDGGKISHFTRQMIYKRTEKEWKAVPKSYPIPPTRV
uniref:Transposase n=1 Tax=Strongyloides venezuelensis TaxID=75913 RepID=A0A0K0F491_STRVS